MPVFFVQSEEAASERTAAAMREGECYVFHLWALEDHEDRSKH